MPRYTVSLHARETLCSGTTAFYFEKPEGFKFEAGQFANFALLTPPGSDLKDHTRAFSIASAPHERHLMVATRLRATDFKRTLNSLPIGAELHLQGPYGRMTLPKNGTRPAVFVAGGIGITPFRSLVWDAAALLSPCHISLFYSFRVREEAAFLEELQEMEKYNKRYKLICTVTQPEKVRSPWWGEMGRISPEMLSKWIPDLKVPIYYIAGPPGMVNGTRQMLMDSGISEGNIHAEEFAGYE
jgi:ferredoxin-NADP reductase